MTQDIEFIFDFSSPNAYFAWKVLPQVAASHDARIKPVPVLLGGIFNLTNNQAPWQAYAKVSGKIEYERLEIARFIERHGLTRFRMNPHFPVNTVMMMRAALVAEAEGCLDTFVDVGLKAVWEYGLKMDDPDVFSQTLTGAGFDGARLLAATQDPDVKAQLFAATEAAVARGVFGVPAFFVGEEMFFGKDRIPQIAEMLSRG